MGKALTSALSNFYEIPFCIDRDRNGMQFHGIPIYAHGHLEGLDKNVPVIVAMNRYEDSIIELLSKEGFHTVFSLREPE